VTGGTRARPAAVPALPAGTGGPARPRVTSPVPAAVWDEVARSDPGTVVSQSPDWRAAVLAGGRYTDTSLLYEFPGGHRIVLPLARRRLCPPWAAVTGSWPGGWGVGGPLCEGGQVSRDEAAAVLADVARWPGVAATLQFRHDPGSAWLAETGSFGAQRRGCHVLDLAGGFGEVWQHRFRGTARTAMRKAERSGVTVEVDRTGRLLPAFCDLYEKSLQRWAARQHEPVWLSRLRSARDASDRVMRLVSRQFAANCGIWVAWWEGSPVAAIIVLTHGGYAKYWRGAMDAGPANRARASDLLHKLAVEDACERGFRWYDMGWTRPGSSLAGFKEKLGADLRYTWTLRTERLPLQATARITRQAVKKLIGFRDV
jgi:GNAT acetyltransferase-like protein